ncbi:MAG TPA: CPBP family intramembrane glutamic endopeptidase [Caulobacteraceae bacterium]|nr:CPBP family intramembrane glutamic endopeptidase [Caulobacteraceae bacterium]
MDETPVERDRFRQTTHASSQDLRGAGPVYTTSHRIAGLEHESGTMTQPRLKPLGLGGSAILFGAPAILLFAATHLGIPLLQSSTGLPALVCWFLMGGFGVFAPLVAASWLMYRREAGAVRLRPLLTRFRLDRFTRRDAVWSLAALVVVGAVTQLMVQVGRLAIHGFTAAPSFMTVTALKPNEYWILLAWTPFFVLNVAAEELFWRGYILPRQELAFGKWAWAAHGAFWTLFHVAFGLDLMFVLSPFLFILSYVAQRRRNTWVSIIVHGALNGGGFLAVALGAIR